MIEVSKYLIRKRLLSIKVIRDYVEDRVYQSHLATITDPSYPCVTLSFSGGSLVSNYPKFSVRPMDIQIWSIISFTEAYAIYNLLIVNLHLDRLKGRGLSIVCSISGEPFELYDDIEKLYRLSTTWTVRMLSK